MSNVSGGLANVWLVISGLSFFCSLCLNAALLYVVVTKVLPIIADLTKKLNELTDKVTVVTDKVESITTTAKSTVDVIHAKTTSILGTAEAASSDVARKISSASNILTTLFVAMRAYNAIKEMKSSHDAKEEHEHKSA